MGRRYHLDHEKLQPWTPCERRVFFVTYDIDEAICLADRVIIFTARPGRIKLMSRSNCPPASLSRSDRDVWNNRASKGHAAS
jgi:ABC-type nitrate/sulfonate/bicarbonate transport system ATPase subunit